MERRGRKRRVRDGRLDDSDTISSIIHLHSVALLAEPPLEIGKIGKNRVGSGKGVCGIEEAILGSRQSLVERGMVPNADRMRRDGLFGSLSISLGSLTTLRCWCNTQEL